jgi:hypothetical protein
VLGRNVTYQPTPEDQIRATLANYFEAEQSEYLIGLFRYVLAGEAAEVQPTVATVLGRPATSFEQFAQDHASLWM